MKRCLAVFLLAMIGLSGVACARHVVVERNTGRVNGDRSITSRSDLEWEIRHEPGPALAAPR